MIGLSETCQGVKMSLVIIGPFSEISHNCNELKRNDNSLQIKWLNFCLHKAIFSCDGIGDIDVTKCHFQMAKKVHSL